MPIVKYVAVHSTPLSNIEYILNGDKTDEMKLATGINCSVNPQAAYSEFKRTFENYSQERFFKTQLDLKNYGTDEKPKFKEKVRIHHYIQSFDPKENVTPEEANKIGVEWAKRFFGENAQVIVATHIDKDHIHNHIAVCPYSLDGKQWHANYSTLKKGRKLSDEIAEEHGLSTIENPKHKNTFKYSEWLARQQGTSWKQKLCDDIDKLIMDNDVRELSDLIEKLKKSGYSIRSGKYISVKAPKQKKSIRTYRLGDGYSTEDLIYRISHKEQEISMAAIQKLSGVQKEYAICMRSMQISVFRKEKTNVTFADLRKSAELLDYLCNNNITDAKELELRLNTAAEKYQNALAQKKSLSAQIEKVDKLVSDAETYLSLLEKDYLSSEETETLENVEYVAEHGLQKASDVEQRKYKLEKLKSELAELEEKSQRLHSERSYLADMFRTYQRDIAEHSADISENETNYRLRENYESEKAKGVER